MKTLLCSLLIATAPLAWGQAATQPGDPNAVPQGSAGTVRADTHSDAQAAYERARADCRGVKRPARRDCLRGAEDQFDREQRDRPAPPLSRPAVNPQ